MQHGCYRCEASRIIRWHFWGRWRWVGSRWLTAFLWWYYIIFSYLWWQSVKYDLSRFWRFLGFLQLRHDLFVADHHENSHHKEQSSATEQEWCDRKTTFGLEVMNFIDWRNNRLHYLFDYLLVTGCSKWNVSSGFLSSKMMGSRYDLETISRKCSIF